MELSEAIQVVEAAFLSNNKIAQGVDTSELGVKTALRVLIDAATQVPTPEAPNNDVPSDDSVSKEGLSELAKSESNVVIT